MADAGNLPAKRQRLSSVHTAKTTDLPNISGDLIQVTAAGGHVVTVPTVNSSGRPLSELPVHPLVEEAIQEEEANNNVPEAAVLAESSREGTNATIAELEHARPAITFNVHRSVLCKSSLYMQQKMQPEQGGFAVTQVDLSEQDPKLVENYIQWLYTDKIAIEKNHLIVNGTPKLVTNQLNLVRNYLLGE
ncbi:hypothetical protein NX059_003366 [Plenodomus lindquistii]|nr:hypothetical protein NX059_003366 [Plenodomus lindquistii]